MYKLDGIAILPPTAPPHQINNLPSSSSYHLPKLNEKKKSFSQYIFTQPLNLEKNVTQGHYF